MKALHKSWIIVLLLAGCAGLGLQSAQTFEQKLAYSYGVNTAIREASTSALNAGSISSADMEHVLKLNDEARSLLDAARFAHGSGDVATAEGRLALATSILVQLQNYLRSKGVQS